MVRGYGCFLPIALFLAVALAACARTAPPAPVITGQNRAPRVAPPMPALRPPPVPPAPIMPPPRVISPPPVLAAPAPTPHPSAITVAAGETLYAIARRYDLPVGALIEANHLVPPYALKAGRRFILPQGSVHTVQPGETLYAISRRYGVDSITLGQVNGLAPPYRVWTGEPLFVPSPAAMAEPGAPVKREALSPPPVAPAVFVPPRSENPPEPAIHPAHPPPRAPAELTALPMPARPRAAGPSFLWPVHGRILGAFGTAENGLHNDGINIAARAGTVVVAADDGVVAYAGNELRGYGNLVLIKHAHGWLTAYAHNSVLLVKRGQRVRRGQPVARVGSTGAVHEPQLHFEIRHGAKALDPADYLAPSQTADVNG